jgi:hypothetical protein
MSCSVAGKLPKEMINTTIQNILIFYYHLNNFPKFETTWRIWNAAYSIIPIVDDLEQCFRSSASKDKTKWREERKDRLIKYPMHDLQTKKSQITNKRLQLKNYNI